MQSYSTSFNTSSAMVRGNPRSGESSCHFLLRRCPIFLLLLWIGLLEIPAPEKYQGPLVSNRLTNNQNLGSHWPASAFQYEAGDFSTYLKGPPTKILVLITLVLFTQLKGSSLLEHVEERLMIEMVQSKVDQVATVLSSPSAV